MPRRHPRRDLDALLSLRGPLTSEQADEMERRRIAEAWTSLRTGS